MARKNLLATLTGTELPAGNSMHHAPGHAPWQNSLSTSTHSAHRAFARSDR